MLNKVLMKIAVRSAPIAIITLIISSMDSHFEPAHTKELVYVVKRASREKKNV